MSAQRVDKKYTLSDSSLNCYGFRLLTSGYMLEEFQRNPIGYYMHDRDGGVLVSWADLSIEDDTVTGHPIINMSHERGQQTLDEVQDGFLNAASMGHIVVLEYSMDPELMLPGQTGPTITKWYNKECSLVDIPGNSNALTTLYDRDNNILNLADMGTQAAVNALPNTNDMKLTELSEDALSALGLTLADTEKAGTAIVALAARATQAEKDLADLRCQHAEKEVTALLADALAARRITAALRTTLAADYAGRPEQLRTLLAAMPAYVPVADRLATNNSENQASWEWDDYDRNDPSGRKLQGLRNSDPARYRELFEKKFNPPTP
ncbi:hypothetical protein GCM10023093_16920 [Nemorincola caseinilytica]|uniref:Mu-like prophage I protein n=1 Tax=Nemorincola caseinilytica TaxID=2054315 RepID=A0ABP8NCU7_9BACT